MEKRKKVSVVITTYNRLGCLIKAIESVIKQTYNYIEIIVVNDNIKQNKELEELLKGYDLLLLHSNCSGANAARLLGFKSTTGEYVSFLDDDDYWLKDKIKNQVSFLEKNPEAILVTSNARVFHEDGTYGGIIYGESNPYLLNYGNFIGGFSFPCIRKKYVKESYFWVGLESAQDGYFWLRLRDENHKKLFLQTNTIELFYQKSKKSITKSKDNKIKGFLKVYNYMKPNLSLSAINWHKYVKGSEYNLGDSNKLLVIFYAFIDYKYLRFLFYIFKRKIKSSFLK